MTLENCPQKISVIIPAFNEESVIQETIRQTCQTLANCQSEIIVVDDGSQDRTYEIACDVCVDYANVKVVSYPQIRGKGYAVRYGFQYATGDLIVFLDADLDLSPQQIGDLYEVMHNTHTDVVIGCKYHPDSEISYPWHRRLFSRGYYVMVHFLFGIPLHDTQTGLKLFRREVLERVFPRVQASGFAYDLEILIAAMRFGYRIAEAPVRVIFNNRPKLGGIGLQAVSRMWVDTLRIFFRASFWRWLEPAFVTKVWMVAFVGGIVVASTAAANAITLMHLPDWLLHIGQYVMLKFIPTYLRNLLLIVLGTAVSIVALIQLNKSLLKAFAHRDSGDLAGIWRKQQDE